MANAIPFLKYACGALACAALTTACVAAGTDWPKAPLRIIVPYTSGGSVDAIGRALAEKLGTRLGQKLVVENIAGGANVPAVKSVLSGAADGYSLLLASDTALSINPHVIKDLTYDPERDLTLATVVSTQPHWIITRPERKDLGNLEDLKAYIKSHPGKVSIGVNVVGGAAHLGLADWRRRNELDFAIVPYRAPEQGTVDLIGGRLDAKVDPIGASRNLAEEGKVKPLAILQDTPIPAFPGIPAQEPNSAAALTVRAHISLAVKAGTPPAIVDRLYQEVRASVLEPDFLNRLKVFTYLPVLTPPEESRQRIQAETARYGSIAKNIDLDGN
ncbi:Bug family tripartite tricarboxylate transporter substrate binding protein [Achromobacter insolitus]|uniref:Bug family tripartite tricarboxylate transporter substrate binding protein n=1 Tax=Achromobacter insolitus TaxID=217204 RepID=UPI00366D4D1C